MTTFYKLWYLTPHKQRSAAVILLFLILLGTIIETLGVGLVIPVVAMMTENDLGARYPAVAPLLERFGNPDRKQLLVFGMFMLVGVYAIKVVFLAFLAWWQARFVYGLQADVSRRLFSGYLNQPYTFHLQRNSAQLIRNSIGQVAGIAGVIRQGLMLLTEILVLVGVSIMLLIVEPLGAIVVVSTLGLAGWGFHRFTRNYLLRWGEALQIHEGFRLQHMQQGLGGVKAVKLLGREDEFIDQYHIHNVGSAEVSQRNAILTALPRLWLELLAVSGLAALILVMISQGKPVEALLPTLGLFAAAAFRLMPSVNRMLGAVQALRFSTPIIETIYTESIMLEETISPKRDKVITFNDSLVLDNVSFQYPSTEESSLKGVSLRISKGSSVGFVGGSGAGKSTLVDIILGLLSPDVGTIKVDGVDIQSNLRSWQDLIGYVSQSIFLTDDSLRRNIALGLPDDEIDEDAVLRAIRAAQLEDFVNDLPDGLDSFVGERGVRVSGGQQQRIGIARALYHDPPVLVLDEATSSLDISTERDFMEALNNLKGDKTLLIVAHRLSTVENCSRLFRLENGRLIEDGETNVVLQNINNA